MAEPTEQDSVMLGDVVRDYVRQAAEPPEESEVLPTGYRDLDEMLAGGLRPEDLCLVAARPSVGKTSMGLGIAYHVAKRIGPTAFFSLEMRPRPLAARVTAWETKVATSRVEARMHTPHDLERMQAASETMADVPLRIVASVNTLTQISAWCHRLKQRDGLKLAVIDYAQLLIATDAKERHQAAAAVSSGLKRLGKDFGIPIVALSQLSRAPEQRQDKRPQLADLRESGNFEQDADIVVLLYRPEMHKPTDENRGIAEVIVAKQRNGPTGVLKMTWLAELTQFADLALGNW